MRLPVAGPGHPQSMPTEPLPPTLAQVVRRATDIVDPDGVDPEVDELRLAFEDRDEPISAIDDLNGETQSLLARFAVQPPGPAVTMAAAITAYLGHRRDEVGAGDETILRLAARSEFDGKPPGDVADWLRDRAVEV
ncbi:MAG: hypothetical protein JWM31_2336 [Solirubrobacterales bacterium]|nr:hypothetical protein [Solirubrobacterales bacterium]